MLFRRSHNSVCVQPRKACPVDSEGDGSAFITRPCLTGEICPGETLLCLCSLNEFRFPFQLLATAQDSFPRSLEHTYSGQTVGAVPNFQDSQNRLQITP